MAHEFKLERRVTFAETDMAGILHFSNFFRYMEEVEHAFFRSLGLLVHTHADAGVFGWARGQAACTYRLPLRLDDLVQLQLLVRNKSPRTLSYEIIFWLQDAAAGAPGTPRMVEAARGSMTVICIARPGAGGRLSALAMPPEVDALIDVAPADLLAAPDPSSE